MAYEDIRKRYNDLYDSQNNSLLQVKNAKVAGYQNNQTDINNQYAEIANGLRNKMATAKTTYGQQQGDVNSKYNGLYSAYDNQKSDTQNKYKQLYTGLDQENAQAKTTNYTDRNNVDVGVNQNMARTQELMAKNGWSGGGENLQATLNSNSDRMNGFGKVDTTMGQTLQGVLNNRNQYKGAEQGTYNEIAKNVTDSKANQVLDINKLTDTYNNNTNDYNNQMTSSNREQTTKIQQIMDAINQANTGYGADSNALRSGLDAQAGQEISGRQQQEIAYQRQQEATKQQQAYETQARAVAYQQQVQAQQVANQQAQRMASSRASVASAKKATTATTSAVKSSVKAVDQIVSTDMNFSEKLRTLQSYAESLQNETGTGAEYMQSYVRDAVEKAQAQMQQYVNVDRYSGYEDYVRNYSR